MKNKRFLILCTILVAVIAICVTALIVKSKKGVQTSETTYEPKIEEEKTEEVPKEKVDIIDVKSVTRPYAIVVNNTPVAVKVQTGLNKAYLVYEFPTEGNTSRLMAVYKDIEQDLTIGTIRSSRHNFIDYALESDAIYVHYGWSHYAEDDERAGSINYINGLFDKPFWRDNPEKLASEHTAYTSTEKIKNTIEQKGYRTVSDNTILLNYNAEDVDLSKKEGAIVANSINIPYGSNPNVTSFKYDSESKMYNRYSAGKNCIDHKTNEQVNTKNIIVQKVNYSMCSDNYYWDLKTIGSGEGYYITNGYAVPIKWSKTSRSGKTKYTYLDGTEIEVSDGRTYIELQTTKQNLTIE